MIQHYDGKNSFLPKHRIILLLLVCILASCASRDTVEESKQVRSQEMYAIYDALLDRHVADSGIRALSVVRFTSSGPDEACLMETSDNHQFRTAVVSLAKNNLTQHELLPLFDLSIAYQFSDVLEKLGGARSPSDGQSVEDFLKDDLSKLQKRLDEGYTQVKVSVPGVSEDGTVAIVYLGLSYAGWYNVLRKADNLWTVDKGVSCLWIS